MIMIDPNVEIDAWKDSSPFDPPNGTYLSFSNSEIQTWKDCRRRWWLTYYLQLGLRPDLENPTGVRNLGSRIHAALQAFYEHSADPIAAIDEIYSDDLTVLTFRGRDDQALALQQEQDLAHAMLEGYLEWIVTDAVDAGYVTIASEQIIEVPSGYPGVNLRGVVDQQRQRLIDGAVEFVDFKTTASIDQLRSTLDIDEQHLHYALILQLHLELLRQQGAQPDSRWRIDGATFRVLRRVKRTTAAQPPFYAELPVRNNPEMIRNAWISIHRVLAEIISALRANSTLE
jgi:RecB family exonuclease